MLRTNKILLLMILLIVVLMGSSLVCYGNAMEPPSIVIIVPNAPSDLEISIDANNEYTKVYRLNRGVEAHYTFYLYDLKKTEKYSFLFKTADKTFEAVIDKPLEKYNNIFTLDLKKQTLTPGKLISRTIILVFLRVILTVIFEGLIFLLFGFRQKKSWIIFIIINLVTQGYLNIWLATSAPFRGYGLIISMILAEAIILITELIVFLVFTKEHSRRRRALFVILANIISFIAGGHLISVLPL
ncbi:MAG: hypothetical protein COA82_09600 [Alkaliphilus sp.]|nr:MAG: hypothetical protein COA82_09600 [Alkaliphilus sp.]